MSLERQCEYVAALGYDGLDRAVHAERCAGENLDRGSGQDSRDRGSLRSGGDRAALAAGETGGLSLTDPDATLRKRTREVMTHLIGLCAELGGSVLVHGSPKQRQTAQGETHATALARLQDAMAQAALAAARAGVVYCIEPLSKRETSLVNTIAEAAELVRAIDHPNFRTMIDCSAAGQSEAESIPDLIDRWLPTGLIAHLQVNDPNRRGPGQGEMKFAPILAALKRHNYAGTIAVEPFDYVPDGAGVAAFSVGYLRGLREALSL